MRSFPLVLLFLVNLIRDQNGLRFAIILIVHETARLLEGMPKSGLCILNIGFGIGMVHILDTFLPPLYFFPQSHFVQIDQYFQDAQPADRGSPNVPGLDAAYRSPGDTHPRGAVVRLLLLPCNVRRHKRGNPMPTVQGSPSILASSTWCTLTHSTKAIAGTSLSSDMSLASSVALVHDSPISILSGNNIFFSIFPIHLLHRSNGGIPPFDLCSKCLRHSYCVLVI